jgi:hypothetical protein
MAELVHNDSIASLIRGVLYDIRDLIREEMALARVEIREQAGRAKMAAASLGVAAVALAFGGTFLLIALAVGIADLLNWPLWTGFLIVALLLSIIGFVMLSTGRSKLRTVQPMPEETVRTLKENSEWLKRRLSSANR